jgi:streptomycin 6-kinase
MPAEGAKVVAGLLDEWSLTPDGEPWAGRTATVLPVRTEDGASAALKVGTRHPGTRYEHLALQHWHGDGAVLLLRADPGRVAMLLERLSTTDLTERWDLEACEVVAGLYARLHRPAPPQLDRLSAYVAGHLERLAALPRSAPVPRRLVEQAVSVGRALVSEPATDGRLLHGDLGYRHVLAGEREPWLAIGPRPLSGDPHYEPAPMLWNRMDELAGDVRGGLRRRFHAIVDAAGLDEDRARDWVVVRTMLNALWSIEDGELGRVTDCVTIAKAVQD